MVSAVFFLWMFAQAAAAQPSQAVPPASFDVLARAAVAARNGKNLDQAVTLYRRALSLKPDWEEGLWELGSIAYDQDRFAECAPVFQRLTSLKSDLAPAWIMAGLCEYGLREYPAALSSLRHAELQGFTGPPELARAARLHLAMLLTKAGHFEKALVILTELTRIDRKTPEIGVAAGIAGLRKPWLPSEVPQDVREMVWRVGDAMATAMEQDPKAAIEKFEAVIREHPEVADIHFRFGAFLMLQAPERGLEEIKKALALDPENIPALVNMAMISLKQGDPQSAKNYAQKAVTISPDDFATHLALGKALVDLEELPAASRELERAVQLAPESPEAHYSLATVYGRLGRKGEADREHAEFTRLRKLIDSSKQH